MTISFEAALNIVAEVAADVPDTSSSSQRVLKGLDWRKYQDAVMVLINSRRELPGPLVIFLPGECGSPNFDASFEQVRRGSVQICDCGNVRLLPGASVKLPNHCPIFIRRRSRSNNKVALLRFAVENGEVQMFVRPFDVQNSSKIRVPIEHLLLTGRNMIGLRAPDAAVLSILNYDPSNFLTEIEVNGQYEIYEAPYDPEVPGGTMLN